MGLDCSRPRKQIDYQVSALFKLIKQRYNTAAQILYSDISPIIKTPMLEISNKVYLKMESHQYSGSFKLRGAFLTFQANINRQIVVASTGNFAKACYYSLKSLTQQDASRFLQSQPNDLYETPTPGDDQVELTQQQQQNGTSQSNMIIFVPKTVNREKLQEIKCPLFYEGDDCVQSEYKAKEYAHKNNSYYASPYNDINMILGSCTIGQELDEYFSNIKTPLDFVFVSVGGGGLIGGIAFYLKYIKRLNTRVIGIQPKNNAAMFNILKGKDYQLINTLSDGTAGDVEENSITIELCNQFVDDWQLVSEEQIKSAQLKLLNENKIVVEGAAALAYAGFLNYPIGECTCAIVLCGSNTSVEKIINK